MKHIELTLTYEEAKIISRLIWKNYSEIVKSDIGPSKTFSDLKQYVDTEINSFIIKEKNVKN